jgi:MarR family transcriptional regulator, organic hydroperoxide resistance regulator
MSMPSRGVGTLLRQLLARLDGDVQAIYDRLNVPFRPRYFPVVCRLLQCGEASVGDLSAAAGVSQPAMTQTIADMKRNGLVQSGTVSGGDPRLKLVRLTREGQATADRLLPVWDAIARAAADLDTALPSPLAPLLEAALAELDRASFERRILNSME